MAESDAEKISKSAEKTAKEMRKQEEAIVDTMEAYYQPAYQFFIRRTRDPGKGFVGKVTGVELAEYAGDIEEYLKENYGGGSYSLQVKKDGKPTGKSFSVEIAPQPSDALLLKKPSSSDNENTVQSLFMQFREDQLRREIDELKEEMRNNKSGGSINSILTAFIPVLPELIDKFRGANTTEMIKTFSDVLTKKDDGGRSYTELAAAMNENTINTIRTFLEMQSHLQPQAGGEGDFFSSAGNFLSSLIKMKQPQNPALEQPQLQGVSGGESGDTTAFKGPTASDSPPSENGISPVKMLNTIYRAVTAKEAPEQVAGKILNAYQTFQLWGDGKVPKELQSVDNIKSILARIANDNDYVEAVMQNMATLASETQQQTEG